MNSQHDQLPASLIVQLLSRSLYQHHTGHGFESRSSQPEVFQALISKLLKDSVGQNAL